MKNDLFGSPQEYENAVTESVQLFQFYNQSPHLCVVVLFISASYMIEFILNFEKAKNMYLPEDKFISIQIPAGIWTELMDSYGDSWEDLSQLFAECEKFRGFVGWRSR